jgi:serine/threonine protein kinase
VNLHVAAIGRYRIEAEIGRGAMGTVYRAFDTVLERPVALKTLNPDLPADKLLETKTRFVLEAKAAGRLNHPNIVTVYDVGVTDDVAYIAMEFLEGQSLHALMRSGATLTFDKVIEIIAQVAEGLDYAGRFGMVHRDIKPANILVTRSGVAKITDFGVVSVPWADMTQAGMMLGSPRYICPEQVMEQPLDPRGDIFSLGVVLYEMLAGKTPFESSDGDVMALLERIAKEPAPRLSAIRPDLPAGLDAILDRTLAKDPEQRFHRGRKLARRLRELNAPGAGAPLGADPEPSGDGSVASLSKLLAEVESSSRHALPAPEGAGEISLQLRKAFHYLEELVQRVIHAQPPFTLSFDLIHLGALPDASLANGSVECTMKKLGGGEVVDAVTLAYRMVAGSKARIALPVEEAAVLKAQLEQAGMKFHSRELTATAGTVREALVIEVDISARAVLRGDYKRQTVEIACQNVGVLGPARYSIPAAEFDEAVWEFGQLLFGLPSRFAGLRLPDEPR